jgi:hypothetical protein
MKKIIIGKQFITNLINGQMIESLRKHLINLLKTIILKYLKLKKTKN